MKYDGGYGLGNLARYSYLRKLPDDVALSVRMRWSENDGVMYDEFVEWERNILKRNINYSEDMI